MLHQLQRQQRDGKCDGSAVAAASLAARQQRGVNSGSSTVGSAVAVWQRQQWQRQLAGSAAAALVSSALAVRRLRAWPWQPLPLVTRLWQQRAVT